MQLCAAIARMQHPAGTSPLENATWLVTRRTSSGENATSMAPRLVYHVSIRAFPPCSRVYSCESTAKSTSFTGITGRPPNLSTAPENPGSRAAYLYTDHVTQSGCF